MKIKKKIIILCICVLTVIIGIVAFVLYKENKMREIIEEKKTLSIFENQLPEFEVSNNNLNMFSFGNMWCIEKKWYKALESTKYTPMSSCIHWKVDLSLLTYCGSDDDIHIFSHTGKSNNGILVAMKEDEYYLLYTGDVLSPEIYSPKEFNVVSFSDEKYNNYFNDLWKMHLSGKYKVSTLCVSEAPQIIELQLKSHPELKYIIGYYFYDEKYYTRLPYNELHEQANWKRVRKSDGSMSWYLVGDGSVVELEFP